MIWPMRSSFKKSLSVTAMEVRTGVKKLDNLFDQEEKVHVCQNSFLTKIMWQTPKSCQNLKSKKEICGTNYDMATANVSLGILNGNHSGYDERVNCNVFESINVNVYSSALRFASFHFDLQSSSASNFQ